MDEITKTVQDYHTIANCPYPCINCKRHKINGGNCENQCPSFDPITITKNDQRQEKITEQEWVTQGE